jgi:cyclic pyranopterin monophosphate synthase
MIDITRKSPTARTATAIACVRLSELNSREAIEQGLVPKGNVLESARVAALFAVKKTADVIPDCHPMPVEFTEVHFSWDNLELQIQVTVSTVYKTGVEVEAMYGASVAALTVYDMLKPIDKQIEITSVRLLNKKGGKSDFKEHAPLIRSSVIVCSDSVSSGKKEDKAGRVILERLKVLGLQEPSYVVIADDAELIRSRVVLEREKGTQLLLFTGGTGLSPRDVTPETIRPLLDREIPGVMEAARAYGQERMPHAMLSRGVAGFIGDMLVLTLPGSTRGAEETMDALFPQLLHVFKIVRGAQHDSDK